MAEQNHSWLDAAIAEAQEEIFGFDRAKASKLMRVLLDGAMPAAQWIAADFKALKSERELLRKERQEVLELLGHLTQEAPEAHLRQEKLRKELVECDKALHEFTKRANIDCMHYFKVVPGVLVMLMDIADRLDLLRAQDADDGTVAAREVSLSDLGGLLSAAQMAQVQAWLAAATQE